MWKGIVGLLLGFWLILSGYIIDLQNPVNMIIVCIVTTITGIILLRKWEDIVNGIVGIWLLVCGLATIFFTALNMLVIGVLIFIISLVYIYHLHKKHDAINKTV